MNGSVNDVISPKQQENPPEVRQNARKTSIVPPQALRTMVRKFAMRLHRRFRSEIRSDARGFKKLVVLLLKSELPPHAGRSCELSVTCGETLHKEGLPWAQIYSRCLALDADAVTKANLRAAIRARHNRRKHKKRQQQRQEQIPL